MANKKIKNATAVKTKEVQLKSILEKKVYNMLKPIFPDIQYEPVTYTVWEGYKPKVPFYNRDNESRLLKLDSKKIISIKYKPDFSFEYKGKLIVIEAKGFENDVFYIKKKLFRKWLEDHRPDSMYFEVYNLRHVEQVIQILNDLP